VPNYNYVGLIGKPRYNDTAVLQDKSSKDILNVQRGDAVGIASRSSASLNEKSNQSTSSCRSRPRFLRRIRVPVHFVRRPGPLMTSHCHESESLSNSLTTSADMRCIADSRHEFTGPFRPRRRRKRRQQGREREKEAIFRGEQVADAIRS
jgi:hypothetical protein